jgi:hypothetical protein
MNEKIYQSNESVYSSNYRTRTSEYYIEMLSPEMQASFTSEQTAAIQTLLKAAIPQPAPKLVDLRFSIDLIVSRFYLVLFVGKDRRSQNRAYLPEPMTRFGNLLAAIMLLISLNLLISLFLLMFVYLVKSAMGIDLFPSEHLSDQINKLR